MNTKILIYAIVGLIPLLHYTSQAQTTIKAGNVNGSWTKKGSPYLVSGDINIPFGESLKIDQGVMVVFQGNYLINVQGTITATGSKKEPIFFTSIDSSKYKIGGNKGWAGIHFDRRPVKWDTLRFVMPDADEFKRIWTDQIKKKLIDTTTKITLSISIPDLVNDTLLPDSTFISKTGSKLEYCQFKYGLASGRTQPFNFGGAIYIYRYSNLLINNCSFENNYAYAGGGIYCKESAPIISNCTFKKCYAQSSGGAAVFINAEPIIINNKFIINNSEYNGGGLLFYESIPYVNSNIISSNIGNSSGGGIFCEKNGNDSICKILKKEFKRDITFEQNELKSYSLQNITSNYGRFLNNIICNNIAVDGGGVSLCATSPEFTNNTISNNIVDSLCGGIFCTDASPVFTNTIVYGNRDSKTGSQLFMIGMSDPVLKYCDIESGFAGIRNDSTFSGYVQATNIINTPPLYYDQTTGNYSLSKESKCIDVGMPNTVKSLKIPNIDLSGKSRIVNNTIDLGAIEYATTNVIVKSAKDSAHLKIKGIESNDSSEVNIIDQTFTTVYPNPSKGIFTINIQNNPYKNINIEIYSSAGQLVFYSEYKAKQWFEQAIDLNSVAGGIYMVMVHSGQNILFTGQLVIE
jgi:predicted outer membrane repeat protein